MGRGGLGGSAEILHRWNDAAFNVHPSVPPCPGGLSQEIWEAALWVAIPWSPLDVSDAHRE